MIIDDPVFGYIKKALDIASIRANLIASNIANADTPHYRAKHIPFKDVLSIKSEELKLKATDPRHIQPPETLSYLIKSSPGDYTERNDQNNVKLDTEMTMLAKNTLLIKALTAFEKYKFNQYMDIISSTRNV